MKLIKHKKLYLFIIILITDIILLIILGNKFLVRFNQFTYENSSIIYKRELDKFIREDMILNIKDLYKLSYNKDNEITGAKLNINYINKYMSMYSKSFNNILNNNYEDFIKDYFKIINIKQKKYVLVPLGFIFDNPFIFNMGPKVLIRYDYINNILFKIDLEVKNYGLNNVLVNVYLDVEISQSVVKPVLERISLYKYKFLLSSEIMYGRVSDYIGTNIKESS